MLRDYTGTEVRPGSVVLNGQGRLFTIRETEPTMAKEGIARCDEHPGLVRAYHCFLIDPERITKDVKARREIYDKLCLTIRAKVREQCDAHRQLADKTLREMGLRR